MSLAGQILLVEDDRSVREALAEYLATLGYRVASVESADVALERLRAGTVPSLPDLILTDVHMPGVSGIELCRAVKSDPRLQFTPVVILTGVADLDARVAGLGAGADDFFAKPVEFLELRTRIAVLLRVKSLVGQLERAESVIVALGATVEARDPYTANHCERVGRYALALGRALGADEKLLEALRLGGYLHDLGKIAVPDSVLLKPGALDAGERARMQAHPVAGADLLGSLRSFDDVRLLVRHHHERWDGTGYPDGLAGEAIPLGARIMAVVDVYDALSTDRPYRRKLSPEESLNVLRRETERGAWDPRVAAAFIDLVSIAPHAPESAGGPR